MITRTVVRSAHSTAGAALTQQPDAANHFTDVSAVLSSTATSGGKQYATFTGLRAGSLRTKNFATFSGSFSGSWRGYLGNNYLAVRNATNEGEADGGNHFTDVSAVLASTATSGGKNYATFTGLGTGSLRRRVFVVEAEPVDTAAWQVVSRPAAYWTAAPFGPELSIECTPRVAWSDSGEDRLYVPSVPIVRYAGLISGAITDLAIVALPAINWAVNPGITSGECNTGDGEFPGEIVAESTPSNYVY